MSAGTLTVKSHEALENAKCPRCGCSPWSHHLVGGCQTMFYGDPEDGFPQSPCTCDETGPDALIDSGVVTTPDAVALAQVVKQHREQRSGYSAATVGCSCGWAPFLFSERARRETQPSALQQYADHVAEQLAAAPDGAA